KKRSQALIQALNQVEPVDVSNLESLYSLDDEPSDSVLCTIAYSELSSDDDSDTDSLEDAKVLSKFDLKTGFWQLGIKTEDRPKTAFFIPDHHYQWKVMPFGLKMLHQLSKRL
nr:RNA-directed DNA polymerase homolog [Tanacetum cinerariifolium]